MTMNILTAIEHSSPLIMGILNVTPDSFSDGGKYASYKSALYQAEKMIEDGVDIIDIGGESTRPGALAVAEKDEVERVIPLLSAIKEKFAVKVSIDTSKAEVMRQAIVHGADMINDVRALQNEGCLAVLAESNLPVCLMHMQGLPSTMQDNPNYDDVISDIKRFFY
jgi:dihydropteroate synthase